VLRQVHPSTKISLSALSVMCDLTSFMFHIILRKLTFVSVDDAAKLYVRELVQVQDTMTAADRSEEVFAAKLASEEGDEPGASTSA
jgi:hypothetical protein